MANKWAVTTEKLESSSNVITEKTAKYHSEYEKLYTEVQNLMSAEWKGIASEAFNSKLMGYKESFTEMENVLKSYAEFLKSAANNYRTTEESLKDAAGNLNSGR